MPQKQLKLHINFLELHYPIGDIRHWTRWPYGDVQLDDVNKLHEITNGHCRHMDKLQLISMIDVACARNSVYVTRINPDNFPPENWQHKAALNASYTWYKNRDEAIRSWPAWKCFVVYFLIESSFENFC